MKYLSNFIIYFRNILLLHFLYNIFDINNNNNNNRIRAQVESPKWMKFSKEKKLHIFERFLANKFNTSKRFGLEGGESCIPGLKFMIDRGSELGVESFCFGMPHRGRLNVLANVMRKPMVRYILY